MTTQIITQTPTQDNDTGIPADPKKYEPWLKQIDITRAALATWRSAITNHALPPETYREIHADADWCSRYASRPVQPA